MRTTKDNEPRGFLFYFNVLFWAILPVALAVIALLTLRVGLVDNAYIKPYAEYQDLYYCLRTTDVPEEGDLILYYETNGNKSVSVVQEIKEDKYAYVEDQRYKLTIIDSAGNEDEIYLKNVFG